MTEIKSLNEYKELKTAEQKQQEFNTIINQLNNCIDMLKPFSRHIEIMESLSILHNSRTLLELKIDKYKRELNEKS